MTNANSNTTATTYEAVQRYADNTHDTLLSIINAAQVCDLETINDATRSFMLNEIVDRVLQCDLSNDVTLYILHAAQACDLEDINDATRSYFLNGIVDRATALLARG